MRIGQRRMKRRRRIGRMRRGGREVGKVGGVVFTPSYGPSSPAVALTLAYCGEDHW